MADTPHTSPGETRLPDGYRLRPAGDGDLTAVAGLHQAVDISRYGRTDGSEADVVEEWALPRLDRGRDAWIIDGPTGEPVAYGMFWAENPPHEAFASQVVHPGHRGLGLTAVLLALGERRAAELAARNGDGEPVSLAVVTDAGDAEQLELFARHGFARAREFLRMEIVMEDPPPAPAWPSGIEVRVFRRGRDERAVYEATDEAFRDHYRPTKMDFDEYWALRESRPGMDYDLWWVAWDGDQVAGSVLALQQSDGVYIDELSVRRPWRGRGIGRALLLHGFSLLYGRGARRIFLGVDSVNPTGAMRVYESVGMRPTRRQVVLEKLVAAG